MTLSEIVRQKNIRVLLSDMDGVIIDSLTADLDIVNTILAEVAGEAASVSSADIRGNFGYPIPEFWQRLLELVGLDGEKDILERVVSAYKKRLKVITFPVLAGAVALFKQAKSIGLATGVVSNNADDRVAELVAMAGLSGLVEQIVGNSGVANSKPAPDIYLLAASRFGVLPAACLTIEDTVLGVQSAKSAGIGFVIGVTTGGSTRDELTRAQPNLIIDSLEELL